LVSIWEHIISFNRIGQVLLLYGVQIHPGCGPYQCGISIIQGIEVLDQSVKGHKVHVGVSESEVASMGHKEMVTLVLVQHFQDIGLHQICLEIRIKGLKLWIIDYRVINLIGVLTIIIGETKEVTVSILDDMGVDLSICT